MPETLTDRQFESYRRVQPGRKLINRKGSTGTHSEEYSQSVVTPEGEDIVVDIPALLTALLLESRRTNMLLELLTNETVTLNDVAGVDDVT